RAGLVIRLVTRLHGLVADLAVVLGHGVALAPALEPAGPVARHVDVLTAQGRQTPALSEGVDVATRVGVFPVGVRLSGQVGADHLVLLDDLELAFVRAVAVDGDLRCPGDHATRIVHLMILPLLRCSEACSYALSSTTPSAPVVSHLHPSYSHQPRNQSSRALSVSAHQRYSSTNASCCSSATVSPVLAAPRVVGAVHLQRSRVPGRVAGPAGAAVLAVAVAVRDGCRGGVGAGDHLRELLSHPDERAAHGVVLPLHVHGDTAEGGAICSGVRSAGSLMPVPPSRSPHQQARRPPVWCGAAPGSPSGAAPAPPPPSATAAAPPNTAPGTADTPHGPRAQRTRRGGAEHAHHNPSTG